MPAILTILLVALFPLVWTFWESLHLHDLRMPWLGRPFIGVSPALRDLGTVSSTGFLNYNGLLVKFQRRFANV